MLQQLPLLAIVFQVASISCVLGHGNIIVPKPSGNSEHPYYIGGPAGTINMAELVEGSSYGDYSKAADAWFSKNNIASLKDYITHYGAGISECGASPTKIPIDVSTCKSSSEFVFYWLALHAQPWQVYINCVALDGSAAASSSSVNSTSTTSQTSGASTTATKTQSTEASIEDEASEAAESTTSTTSTTKTSDTAVTPSVTKSKCAGRRSLS